MPNLVRKLLIFAAAEGLLLQPVTRGNQSPSPQSVKIDYRSNVVSPSLRHDFTDVSNGEGLEAHGIVGVLRLASSSYLISISGREQVAQIRGKPIYVVTDVALIPLSSRSDAQTAITNAREAIRNGKVLSEEDADSDSDSDDDGKTVGEDDDRDSVPSTPSTEAPDTSKIAPLRKASSVVTDVIQNRGSYGRFANRWFSKAGWKSEGRRKQGMSSEENLNMSKEQMRAAGDIVPDGTEQEAHEDVAAASGPVADDKQEPFEEPQPSATQSSVHNLTPRILASTKLFFASRSFYFSYDYDISRSLSRQEAHSSSVPLYKRFDPLYFWNHHLIQPIISSGQSGFVLPLIQGFVGQRAFTIAPTDGNAADQIIDSKHFAGDVLEMQERAHSAADSGAEDPDRPRDFLLTLLSRRSIKRAGLRYLRRGVDDQGNVANAVETEQILSESTWDPKDKSFSFVQIRGSIPVFFSQSPYAFKPIPIQYGSEATNQAAFKKHFANVLSRYGDVYCTSLVDKHANELKIGQSYEEHAAKLNSDGGVNGKKIAFEWFDFHGVCKGMKFENVSILMDTLTPFMTEHKWTTQQNNHIVQAQTGVLRVNCMDCLDRTNVVQSASAGQTLQKQLEELGLSINLSTDPKTSWFNTLWADNGDAISKQYAGTAALKGDFTRTRKRHWTGALSDFSLTLNRYYNNIFGDYFLQTCISYYLGEAGLSVFEEFETNMMTRDPSLNLSKVRESAIETCTRIVLEDPDEEDFFAGWTLACPANSEHLRSLPFEECILLLTDRALYFCRFDWTTEKLASFERVDLLEIEGLEWGAYVTSTLNARNMDEDHNVGFVVRYRPIKNSHAMVRTNTRSLDNEKRAEVIDEEADTRREQVVEAPKTDEEATDPKAKANTKNDKIDDKKPRPDVRTLAFKALPPSQSARKSDDDDDDDDDSDDINDGNNDANANEDMSGSRTSLGGGGKDVKHNKNNNLPEPQELVKDICAEIERLASAAYKEAGQASSSSSSTSKDDTPIAVETGVSTTTEKSTEKTWSTEPKPIISLAEAKNSTGYFETLQYNFKKLVWA
ncbi:hypothetical protein AAFC00_000723 [Neodothiora populina]|uniref:SacI domain-containing protein n=1 Tax=Neodothiora populina TaxID=2781224 RepID=A0ABR3PDY0_9PEZI